MRVLIVDKGDSRRIALLGVLKEYYLVDQQKQTDTISDTRDYSLVVVHKNNWNTDSEWVTFRNSLKNIPFIPISGGAKEAVLYLSRGDEYSGTLWREAIEQFMKEQDINALLKLMYRTHVTSLVEALAPLCMVCFEEGGTSLGRVRKMTRNRLEQITGNVSDPKWPNFWTACKTQCNRLGDMEGLVKEFIAGDVAIEKQIAVALRDVTRGCL